MQHNSFAAKLGGRLYPVCLCPAVIAGAIDPFRPLSTGRLTFQRASRLTQAVEFRRVFSRPVVSQDRFFRVLSRSNGLTRSRVGLAVSKKACKRATGRNRLKRLVRESFRHHQHDPGMEQGLDFVVLPSAAAATICNERLSRALAGHWRQCVEKHRSPHRSSKGNY